MKANIETKSRKQKGLELKNKRIMKCSRCKKFTHFFKGLKVILLLPFALPLFGQ
jgi:hypothetical protein